MHNQIPTLNEIDFKHISNRTALVRVDFNVPFKKSEQKKQVVSDDTRIRTALKTIAFLLERQFKVLILTHVGRPKGKQESRYSVQPIIPVLEQILAQPVCFAQDISAAQRCLKNKKRIILLENIRFFVGEENNDSIFAKQLAELADIYVNEAFSTAHRKHASIVSIPTFLPSYAGFSFCKEVEMLGSLMDNPTRPFVMVIGGSKISDKVEAVRNLAHIADAVLIGGGTANNFLKAEGIEVCKSLVEENNSPDKKKRSVNYVEVAKDMINANRKNKLLLDGYIPVPHILLPIDVVASPSVDESNSRNVETIELLNGNCVREDQKELMYLDIGPKTIKLFKEIIMQAGTIFWNGPMGVFEKKLFETGTKEIARTVAKAGATTILGGGDTIASIRTFSNENRYDYVSAAGGAALEFLAGKKVVGITALQKARKTNNSLHTNTMRIRKDV